MTRKWNEFWFRPTTRSPLIATRFILALQALWIVASRPDLPLLAGWPYSNPVADLSFNAAGKMLLGERSTYYKTGVGPDKLDSEARRGQSDLR